MFEQSSDCKNAPPATFWSAGNFLRSFFMWFPDSKSLAASTPETLFVALRWHEYFDGFTTDSFQPRITSLASLVEELASASKECVSNPQYQGHLERVQAELAGRLSGDVENAICTPREIFALQSACAAKDPAIARDATTHLLSEGFRTDFEHRILEQGPSAILKALCNPKPSKSLADAWLGAWATIGIHRDYIARDDVVKFDDELLKRPVDQVLAEIQQKLTPVHTDYECVLELKLSTEVLGLAPEHREQVRQQLTAVMRKAAGNLPPQDIIGAVSNERVLVHGRKNATGAALALAQFCAQIQPAINLFNLYRNGSTIHPLREGWVGLTMSSLNLIPLREMTLQKLHPRKKAAELTLHALSQREALGRVDPDVANALELYHVAMTTDDTRVGFLTLWSAMECLGLTVEGSNILERITRLVAPIVTWRRIEKHLRYLTINLKFARDTYPNLKTTPCPGLPNSTESKVFLEDVLETVSKPENDPRIASLCAHAGLHPLLVWRVGNAWKSFHSAKILREEMATSRRRVEWQLGRIYRARNALVHRGDETFMLGHLRNNLQYYFSTTISRLLHGTSDKTERSARQSVYRWCSHYDYVVDSLSKAPNRLTISDLLPEPERARNLQIWPAKNAP